MVCFQAVIVKEGCIKEFHMVSYKTVMPVVQFRSHLLLCNNVLI